MFKSVQKEEIQVPAHIDYLGELRNFVTKTGRKHHFSDTVVNAFKLSIDEAATNIIKHAYRDWEGKITMRVIIKKESMTVILIDKGKYFDPSRVKDPDLDRYVNIGKKGGLGIFIMRKLLDEIDYRHTEEGNELRLTKYREIKGTEKSKRKKKIIISTPSISMSLKSKYSTITAAILTAIVIIGYFYFFVVHGNRVLRDFVASENPVCENIAKNVLQSGEFELNPLFVDSKVLEFIHGRNEIYRIIVTDFENMVVSSTDTSLVFEEFQIPKNHENPRPNLISYKDKQNITIYAFFCDVTIDDIQKTKTGTVYLEVKKNYVNSQIASLRIKDLRTAVLILAIGYLGIMFLIYIIMNPFRKLADWVKDLGHGEVKDEIDFDTSDEVGEIAKAFSEITDSLRNSQKNLAEQERIQKEMQLAQDIQQALLPSEVPTLEGYEIDSFYESAKEVGGDYFDFIEVDKDTLGIVVADVSGKGVPGSLVMTMIRTALRTEARSIKSASEVLARVNDFVVKDMKKGMFVTLFYVIIDSKKRRINYASAGHNPMVLYRKTTQQTYYLNPRGFPVGLSLPDPELFKKSIESDTIQLAEDDILLIYTDGITEAMNNRRELFSEERLQKSIHEHGGLPVKQFVENLKDEINVFTEGFEQNDDITFVAIKEKSSPEKIELQRAQKSHQMILDGMSIREACEECRISVYAYNKYKKKFEEEGVDAFFIDETISVESKHLSIEEKTKIYDIIKLHPEYGAKRISEELNTERYGFTQINENRLYDELVRSRLNTRQLREAYVARSGRKKRMKPPGTPMLTLDGKIILDRRFEEYEPLEPDTKVATPEKAIPTPKDVQKESKKKPEIILPKDPEDNFYLESLMSMPIEELLKKQRKEKQELERFEEEPGRVSPVAETEKKESADIFEEFETDQTIESGVHDSFVDDEEIDDEQMQDGKELELDDDLSFRDIWEQKEDDISLEIEDDIADKEADQTIEPNNIDLHDDEQDEVDKISKSPIDIDDILIEDEDKEIIGFEMLAEDTSFI